jgi:hypothetical protein
LKASYPSVNDERILAARCYITFVIPTQAPSATLVAGGKTTVAIMEVLLKGLVETLVLGDKTVEPNGTADLTSNTAIETGLSGVLGRLVTGEL